MPAEIKLAFAAVLLFSAEIVLIRILLKLIIEWERRNRQ